MGYTPYDTSVVVCKGAVQMLRHILQVAEKQPNGSELPRARLHPDMQPLTFEVECVSTITAKVTGRLSGASPVPFKYGQLKAFEDMYKRLDQTDEVLDKAEKELIHGRVDQTIPLPDGNGGTAQLPGDGQVFGFTLPDMFFHVTIAYGILRKEGVPLRKSDYLDGFSERWT